MDDLSNKTACIYDDGPNVELAIRLAQEFGRVRYFKPWKKSFPTTNDLLVGDGFENVERVRDFFSWENIQHTDIFIFPDIYNGDLQLDLERRGKRVWGSRMAENCEYQRDTFIKCLKESGLPVMPHHVCKGVTKLREYLMEHDNQWVKVDLRGDGETWKHINYSLSERKLEALEYQYGPVKEKVRFTVCEHLATDIEAAYDGFMITSQDRKPQFPDVAFLGYEDKDQAHILTAVPYDDLSEDVKVVNSAFAPCLAKYFFRSAWGTEIKILEEPHFLDATCRQPSPPGEIIMEMVGNLGQFMWHGSIGDLIPLELENTCGSEIILYSWQGDKNWKTIQTAPENRRWLKLCDSCEVDGDFHVVPAQASEPLPECSCVKIGSVVGLGDTIEESIEQVKAHCDQIEGFNLHSQITSLLECLKRIHEGEEQGIEFGDDEIPKPETVLQDL